MKTESTRVYVLTDGSEIMQRARMTLSEFKQANLEAATSTDGNLFWGPADIGDTEDFNREESFAFHGQQEDPESITGRGVWGNGY